MLALVQHAHDHDGNGLRQTVPAGENGVLQTEHDQQTDDGAGQHGPQIADEGRRLFSLKSPRVMKNIALQSLVVLRLKSKKSCIN